MSDAGTKSVTTYLIIVMLVVLLMQVNALGPLWLIDAILPGMQDRGSGKIVLVSSVGGGITQFTGKASQ